MRVRETGVYCLYSTSGESTCDALFHRILLLDYINFFILHADPLEIHSPRAENSHCSGPGGGQKRGAWADWTVKRGRSNHS